MQPHAFDGAFYLRPVFYVAVAFILFFVIFGRRLARAVTGTLDQRIATIQRELQEAATLRTEAEAMLADAEAQRQAAIEQSAALLASAQRQAEQLAVTMEQDARQAAERRQHAAMERIAAAEQAVVRDLRLAAIDIAAAVSEQLLATTLTAGEDATLIDHAIAGLPAAMRAA